MSFSTSNKIDSPNPFFKNSFISVVASILSVGMLFLSNVLVARHLGIAGKGSYDLVISTTACIATFTNFSISSGLVYISAKNLFNFFYLALSLHCFILFQMGFAYTFLIFMKSIGISEFVLPDIQSNTILISVILLGINNLFAFFQSILIGKEAILKANIADIAGKLLTLIGLGLLFFNPMNWASLGFIEVLSLLTIGNMVSAILSLISITNHNRKSKINLKRLCYKTLIESILRYSLPCYLATILQFVNYRFDVFIINGFSDTQKVGIYSISVMVSQLVWIISGAVARAILPRISNLVNDGNKKEATKITVLSIKLLFPFSAFLGAIVCITAPLIIPLLFGKEFSESVLPLQLIMPGAVIFTISSILGAFFCGIGKPQICTKTSLFGCLFTLTLDFILIPQLGISGAAIASSLSYMATTASLIWYFLNETGLKKNVLFFNKSDYYYVKTNLIRLISRKK